MLCVEKWMHSRNWLEHQWSSDRACEEIITTDDAITSTDADSRKWFSKTELTIDESKTDEVASGYDDKDDGEKDVVT